MKKLIYLILCLVSQVIVAKVPTAIVEQHYLSVLAKSFTDNKFYAPRSPLYWSLCLGETEALSKPQLSNRISALENDSAARIAFYKRLNFYRGYKSDPTEKSETYGPIFLPYEKNPKKNSAKQLSVPVLGYDNIVISEDDWTTYSNYVTSLGDDDLLNKRWTGPVTNVTKGFDVDSNDKVYVKADSLPQFPGGDAALLKFLQWQIEYPQMERDNDIQGKVLFRFVVRQDGYVSAGTIAHGVSPGLNQESMLIIKMLPRFIPGKQNGNNVSVYFNLPIVFRLQ